MQPTLGVILVAFLSLIGVVSITFISINNPDHDQTLINTILGFLAPTIGTILAIMIKNIHSDINSRMTELLELTRSSSLAEGKLSGKENENFVERRVSKDGR